MSVLYITEYNQPQGGPGTPQCPNESDIVAEQTLAISATNAVSAAFNAATNLVALQTDTTCSLQIAAAPVGQAVTTTQTGAGAAGSQRLPANVPVFKTVKAGQSLKVGAVTTT